MVKFRILPLLIVAVTGLLCLKAMGIIVRGGYLFPIEDQTARINLDLDPSRRSFGRVLTAARTDPDIVDPITTGSVPDKKKPKVDPHAAKADDAQKMADAKANDAKPVEVPVTQAPPMPPSGTERQLMERLKDRRSTLEERSRELDLRENLLNAAEKKIEDRLGDLKSAEGRADVTGTAKAKAEQDSMRPLVIMYEAMKPKEAARVFEKLDMKVLVPVVLAMNPRKMSEVLASMSPESAEKLTTALATRGKDGMGNDRNDALPAGELPRLDQKK